MVGLARVPRYRTTLPGCGCAGLRFAAVDGGELPDYLPGQHITLRVLAGLQGELTRAYSLTGAASLDHRHEYTIAVRHQSGLTATGEPY